ncbi:hypothetical protein HYU18_01340 [Candidatus Woesearchaeota archaeon]|nr:hypothetical protein [Candidatus Woesearchaeota archaeon]
MKLGLNSVFFAVFLALLAVAVLRPAFIGYGVKDVLAESYGGQWVENVNATLSHYSELNERVMLAMEKNSERFISCSSELSACKANLSFGELSYSAEIARLEREVARMEGLSDFRSADFSARLNETSKRLAEAERAFQEKVAELDGLRSRYDALAFKAANNICCKQRIDDPSISYYSVDNEKIVCSGSGALKLSC